MVITCPDCQTRYKIDPKSASKKVARVKCPACNSLFEVNLDVSAESRESGRDPAPTEAAGSQKILVVDDARFFREMLKDLLKDLPVEILTAANGDEAWQQIKAEQPKLVMLDLNIPGRGGREILCELRKNPEYDRTKVVVMSGVARGEETVAELRRAGADDFISKSFKPRELENRVRQLMGL